MSTSDKDDERRKRSTDDQNHDREGAGDDVVGVRDIEIEIKVREPLKLRFRPEFLNRIDETIIFRQLTRGDLVHIVDIQTQYLQKRLADRGMRLSLTDAAKTKLARDGYEPT